MDYTWKEHTGQLLCTCPLNHASNNQLPANEPGSSPTSDPEYISLIAVPIVGVTFGREPAYGPAMETSKSLMADSTRSYGLLAGAILSG